MFARLAEHALRGELVATYDGGVAERNAIIETTVGRGAAEHRAELAAKTVRLEAAWAEAGETDWSRPVTFRDADLAATVRARWREVWIHMVDLELGVRPGPRNWLLTSSTSPSAACLRAPACAPRTWLAGGPPVTA